MNIYVVLIAAAAVAALIAFAFCGIWYSTMKSQNASIIQNLDVVANALDALSKSDRAVGVQLPADFAQKTQTAISEWTMIINSQLNQFVGAGSYKVVVWWYDKMSFSAETVENQYSPALAIKAFETGHPGSGTDYVVVSARKLDE